MRFGKPSAGPSGGAKGAAGEGSWEVMCVLSWGARPPPPFPQSGFRERNPFSAEPNSPSLLELFLWQRPQSFAKWCFWCSGPAGSIKSSPFFWITLRRTQSNSEPAFLLLDCPLLDWEKANLLGSFLLSQTSSGLLGNSTHNATSSTWTYLNGWQAQQ